MLYVYVIIDTVGAVSGTGHDERPLETEVLDGVAAVFSRHETRIAPTPQNLWRHEEVVEALMKDHTLLPGRFGTALQDESALRRALVDSAPALSSGLESVRGCVELGLRVFCPQGTQHVRREKPDSDRVTGRAYMLARLAEEQERSRCEAEAAAAFDRAHAHLEPLARESRRSTTGPALTAAYLVERASVDRFREAVREWRGGSGGPRVVCTGPWPPYSFVPALDATARKEAHHA